VVGGPWPSSALSWSRVSVASVQDDGLHVDHATDSLSMDSGAQATVEEVSSLTGSRRHRAMR
jgi:hypothetical protein